MSNSFSISRLVNLMKIDLRVYRKSMLIAVVAFIIVLALMPIQMAHSLNVYFALLYVGGFIITSLAFNEMHDPLRGDRYLLLPGSHLEKFISKWLLTSLFYIVSVLVIYYAFLLLSTIIYSAIYGVAMSSINLFKPELWLGLAKYMVIHSFVLLGSVIFKRYVLVKTALVLGILVIVINILKALFADSLLMITSSALASSHFIFWSLIIVFCWYLTYLKLSESEIG